MGACASRQDQMKSSSSMGRKSAARKNVDDQVPPGMNPMVSMSFLKKYSFATVNPAFADFETSHRNPEEEDEAISKLRALAQESFGSAWQQQNQHPAQESEEDFSGEFNSRSARHEIEEMVGCSNQLTIRELREEEINPTAMRNSKSRVNSVKIAEEKLVMSSSCMPNYSLGVVVNPEVRRSSRTRL